MLTPADVEYVRYQDLIVGDTTVHFTAIGRDIDIPPTQRQLNAKRTKLTVVTTIDTAQTGQGVAISSRLTSATSPTARRRCRPPVSGASSRARRRVL